MHHVLLRSFLAVPLFAVALAGCGDDSSSGGGSAGGADLVLSSHFEEGSLKVQGTVTFPEALSQSTTAALALTTEHQPSSFFSANEFRNETVASGIKEVTYSVEKLKEGVPYWVALVVDLSGDGAYGDGDWAGMYDPMGSSPVADPSLVAPIVLTDSLSGADFALAPVSSGP